MRSFILALPIIAITLLTSKAEDKDDISLAFEFARMKLRSDYPNDLSKATKEGQLFVLWVGYEDPELYDRLLKEQPDAVHSFVTEERTKTKPGLVLGIRRTSAVEQVKVISVPTSGALNTKEVILITKSLDHTP